jgi:hypothetical protein
MDTAPATITACPYRKHIRLSIDVLLCPHASSTVYCNFRLPPLDFWLLWSTRRCGTCEHLAFMLTLNLYGCSASISFFFGLTPDSFDGVDGGSLGYGLRNFTGFPVRQAEQVPGSPLRLSGKAPQAQGCPGKKEAPQAPSRKICFLSVWGTKPDQKGVTAAGA